MIYYDVTGYSYDPRTLRKLLRKDDFWRYQPLDPNTIDDTLASISKEFALSDCKIHDINRHTVGKMNLYTMDSIYDALTIRRTNDIIRRSIHYAASSRDDEIAQLWAVLSVEKKNSWVFRSDVKSFYENLSFRLLVDGLLEQKLICHATYKHLSSIADRTEQDGCYGLPRGLPISSSLSEYAMNEFDQAVRGMKSVVYYARYVDDILIITTRYIQDFRKVIEKRLQKGLSLNDEKTSYTQVGTAASIDFLGFSFPLDEPKLARISNKKIGKIKKRIILSVKAYMSDNDFELLVERLQFLTGITQLKMASRDEEIAVGIRYQYHLCDQCTIESQLSDLDTFFHRILNSKRFNLSKKLQAIANPSQLAHLSRISFVAGYRNLITHRRSRQRISRIKDAWRYE